MRAESDKKNKKSSITMTESDYEIIAAKARERGMGVSPYMVNCALHSEEGVTPEKKARMQTIVNNLCMRAEDIAPEMVNRIRKECEDIWSL